MGVDPDVEKEGHVKGSLNSLTQNQIKNINNQMKNCVCKIIYKDESGTGFFCRIPFPDNYTLLPVLITCNHVLSKKHISKGKTIKLMIDNKPNFLLIDESRMVYTNRSKDITLIEIKRNDNINLEYFLEVDKNLNNNENYASYIGIPVYILHFEKGKEQRYSEGVILEIKGSGIIGHYKFFYSCSTDKGSSGGPIINSSNFKVIGLHHGYKKSKDLNEGTLIGNTIKEFYSFNKNKYLSNLEHKSQIKENDDNDYRREKIIYDNKDLKIEKIENEEEEEYEENDESEDYEEYEKQEGKDKEKNKSKEDFHEHPLTYNDEMKNLCNICFQNIDNTPGYRCDYCKIIVCLDCKNIISDGEKKENIHLHPLKLKYRSDWVCYVCKSHYHSDKCASFYCEICNFDA